MRKYSRVIFAVGNGTTRAPMAAEILKTMTEDTEILARGIVVAFPEPINPKAESVMVSNGITISNYAAQQIEDDEITPDTIIFVMEEPQRHRLIGMLEHATEENTFVLSDYVGEELEVMDPYGGTLQTYGICFESLRNTIKRLADKLFSEDMTDHDTERGSSYGG